MNLFPTVSQLGRVQFFFSPSLDASHGPVGGPGCHGFMCGVFRGQACVFEAQKRVSERAHALDQATGPTWNRHIKHKRRSRQSPVE